MISLRSTPFNIDFSGNKPRFNIKCRPFVQKGKNDTWTFIVFQIPYVSGVTNTFALGTPYGNITRTIIPQNTASDTPTVIRATNDVATIRERILDKLCNDASIIDNYVVNVWTGALNNVPCCYFQLSERKFNTPSTITFDYKQNGVVIENVGGNPVIYFNEHIPGSTELNRPNYSVVGKFIVSRYKDKRGEYLTTDESETESFESPSFRLQCSGDNATIDTSMLLSYFNCMDIPKIGETVEANIVRHNMIRYRIQYAETYDSISTIYYRTSKEFSLLNGNIERNCFIENKPDWESLVSGQISTYDKLVNWGSDRSANRRIFIGCESYVYVANFTSYSRNATVRFTIGNTVTNTNVSVPPHAIVRIPVHISSANAYKYRVEILDGSFTILNHLFEIVPKPYNAHVLLLQNHVGLAETFYVDSILTEKDIDSDEVVLNDALLSDISSKGTSLTVRTGYKTKKEMELLGSALQNTDNYLLYGNLAYRINFTDSSISIIDENEDLQSAEFNVSLGIPISREIKHVNENTVIVGPITDNTTFYQVQI